MDTSLTRFGVSAKQAAKVDAMLPRLGREAGGRLMAVVPPHELAHALSVKPQDAIAAAELVRAGIRRGLKLGERGRKLENLMHVPTPPHPIEMYEAALGRPAYRGIDQLERSFRGQLGRNLLQVRPRVEGPQAALMGAPKRASMNLAAVGAVDDLVRAVAMAQAIRERFARKGETKQAAAEWLSHLATIANDPMVMGLWNTADQLDLREVAMRLRPSQLGAAKAYLKPHRVQSPTLTPPAMAHSEMPRRPSGGSALTRAVRLGGLAIKRGGAESPKQAAEWLHHVSAAVNDPLVMQLWRLGADASNLAGQVDLREYVMRLRPANVAAMKAHLGLLHHQQSQSLARAARLGGLTLKRAGFGDAVLRGMGFAAGYAGQVAKPALRRGAQAVGRGLAEGAAHGLTTGATSIGTGGVREIASKALASGVQHGVRTALADLASAIKPASAEAVYWQAKLAQLENHGSSSLSNLVEKQAGPFDFMGSRSEKPQMSTEAMLGILRSRHAYNRARLRYMQSFAKLEPKAQREILKRFDEYHAAREEAIMSGGWQPGAI